MFTKEKINEIKNEFTVYTGYNIPEINSIIYKNTIDFYGEVTRQEILSGNYTVHLSNSLNDCPETFQKAVLFHEFTHIYDLISNSSLPDNNIEGIMNTYSEAHAEAIKLRYLLNINLRRKINQGVRYLVWNTGRKDLGTVTSTYLNYSLEHCNNFQRSKQPKHFKKFIYSYCHFCGYLSIRIDNDVQILLDGILSKFPNQYHNNLIELYYAIANSDLQKCCVIYAKLKLEAMITTIDIVEP